MPRHVSRSGTTGPGRRAQNGPDPTGEPGEAWFSVSPASGVGNGRDYQYVTVTAQRNPGGKRTGYLYLKSAGGEVAVTVTQSDGRFSVEDPVISGSLRTGSESAASLDIVYDKAFGGERVLVEASLAEPVRTDCGSRRLSRRRSSAKAAARFRCRSPERPPRSATWFAG